MVSENRLHEMVHLLNEAFHPADRMAALDAALPPEVGERMLLLDHLNRFEPGRQPLRDLDFVEARNVIADGALSTVDLDCRRMPVACGNTRRLDGADRAGFELQD